MTVVCCVCSRDGSKYKCPKCFSSYCTVDCYKRHKESTKCEAKASSPKKVKLEENTEGFPNSVTEDTVTELELEKLGELKPLLKNTALRKTIRHILCSSNPAEDLHLAMLDPDFVGFVDECLKLVENK